MCVDLLAQNLQPACVDACLGHALEFGEIGKYEQDHPEALTQIAGFPDPCISKPNVRFEQSRSLPTTMKRADAELLQYQSNGDTLPYQSVGSHFHGIR